MNIVRNVGKTCGNVGMNRFLMILKSDLRGVFGQITLGSAFAQVLRDSNDAKFAAVQAFFCALRKEENAR